MSDENVIHVQFGPGGGRLSDRPDAPAPDAPSADEAPRPRKTHRPSRVDPYAQLFRRAEVARLFDLTEGRLKYWAKTGFLEPSGRIGRRRYYTFEDLIGIRAARELLANGTPLRAVRKSLENLRETLPHVTRPLNELRVVAEGQRVIVHDQDTAFDARTGQLQLDFEVRSLRDDVVRVLHTGVIDPERKKKAYEAYLEGCRYDEEPDTYARAEACYEEALRLDPQLANALTNWGNLRFRQGDAAAAESLYRRALDIDREQPEALYNLGFLAFERGELADAITFFALAAEHDPAFADAQFNLAMALEGLGRHREARAHWLAYLEIDPDGSWAEIARRHLEA